MTERLTPLSRLFVPQDTSISDPLPRNLSFRDKNLSNSPQNITSSTPNNSGGAMQFEKQQTVKLPSISQITNFSYNLPPLQPLQQLLPSQPQQAFSSKTSYAPQQPIVHFPSSVPITPPQKQPQSTQQLQTQPQTQPSPQPQTQMQIQMSTQMQSQTPTQMQSQMLTQIPTPMPAQMQSQIPNQMLSQMSQMQPQTPSQLLTQTPSQIQSQSPPTPTLTQAPRGCKKVRCWMIGCKDTAEKLMLFPRPLLIPACHYHFFVITRILKTAYQKDYVHGNDSIEKDFVCCVCGTTKIKMKCSCCQFSFCKNCITSISNPNGPVLLWTDFRSAQILRDGSPIHGNSFWKCFVCKLREELNSPSLRRTMIAQWQQEIESDSITTHNEENKKRRKPTASSPKSIADLITDENEDSDIESIADLNGPTVFAKLVTQFTQARRVANTECGVFNKSIGEFAHHGQFIELFGFSKFQTAIVEWGNEIVKNQLVLESAKSSSRGIKDINEKDLEKNGNGDMRLSDMNEGDSLRGKIAQSEATLINVMRKICKMYNDIMVQSKNLIMSSRKEINTIEPIGHDDVDTLTASLDVMLARYNTLTTQLGRATQYGEQFRKRKRSLQIFERLTKRREMNSRTQRAKVFNGMSVEDPITLQELNMPESLEKESKETTEEKTIEEE